MSRTRSSSTSRSTARRASTSRSKRTSSTRSKPRPSSGSRPARRTTTRARTTGRKTPKTAAQKPARQRHAPEGPIGWDALSKATNRRKKKPRASRAPWLDRIPTVRYVAGMLLAAVALTLYVGHVHATQALLAEVQQAQRQNLRLHLKYNRLKGEYDRMTGPAVIHRRARELGLVEDYHYAPTIVLPASP